MPAMPYLLRRLLAAIAVLFVASIAIFVLLHLAPGNPANVIAGQDATPAQVAAVTRQLHLDQSLPVQYWHWLVDVLGGHLGQSYILRQPIGTLIGQRLGSTLQLMVAAALIMTVLGVLLGIVIASSRRRWLREGVDFVATIFLSAPPFVSSVIFVFVFAITWKLLPATGQTSFFSDPWFSVQYLLLPSVAIALPGSATIARLLATEMRRTEQEEFVRTAVAKGARRSRVVWRHVLPNSIGPAVVELGIRIGEMFAGAVVVESLFARSGIGSLLVTAVSDRDYLLADDLLLMSVAFAILMQLLTEVGMSRIDRRIRLEGSLA
jgi:peptide/nickel transport system permease protein